MDTHRPDQLGTSAGQHPLLTGQNGPSDHQVDVSEQPALNQPPQDQTLGNSASDTTEQSEEMHEYMSGFYDLIKDSYKQTSDRTVEFNYETLGQLDYAELKRILTDVFTRIQGKRALLSIEVSYLLRHSFTHALRWFYGSNNTVLTNQRLSLTANLGSLHRILKLFEGLNFRDMLNMEETVWQLDRVTNVTVKALFFRRYSR